MDLVLRNARLVDGTGAPAFTGDIAVHDGRIAAIGKVTGHGVTEVDVAGAVVAPGFIDVHTHYDAQVTWDPYLTPSVLHGVTTVIAGNCGFTLAPLSGRAEDAAYLVRMLSRVEGMPLATLQKAINPTWKGFGEYLHMLEDKIAINAAFLVGHSALRRKVMGERAVGHEATEAEIEAMAALLRQSLAEGGVGFSTSVAISHTDYEGRMVPSRWASRAELLRLAEVTGEFAGTWLEIAFAVEIFTETEYALMTDMSKAARRFINWNFLQVNSALPNIAESQLAAGDYAAAHGGKVIALVQPIPARNLLNFISGFLLDVMPGWSEFLTLPTAEKIAGLKDPSVRAMLAQGPERCDSPLFRRMFSDWGRFHIENTGSEANRQWCGKPLSAYAAHVGKEPLAALLDLAIEENLDLAFALPPTGGDAASWTIRAAAWRDQRCVVGASDAGAHLDMINSFAFATQLLGECSRTRGLISLEEAVQCITQTPARQFGLTGRGELKVGNHADLVAFDPATVGCGPIEIRHDLPENQPRLFADAEGIKLVIVNGRTVVANKALTGELGGKVLHSGRDTHTVAF